jgi:hypothetical protein
MGGMVGRGDVLGGGLAGSFVGRRVAGSRGGG